ncbi:MAG TPA: NADH:ubiquinone oxidoreductase subunit NDUFA12 [Sphingomicrobium sp.]|nr:NADH:ubiquinone oxidoreductase subunit NDUFA12 [Sphingomicrobium sp.]
MGLFANLFTWWNGASLGTTIVTRLRGEEAGRDEAGNIYFTHRKDPTRRWVIYQGSNDSSNVPPGWNAWLRGTIADVPGKSLPPRRAFEREPQANLTGSDGAWRPSGSMKAGARRPTATGDYIAWTPEEG